MDHEVDSDEEGPAAGAPDLNVNSDEDPENLNLDDTAPQVSAKKRPALEDAQLDALSVDELERESDLQEPTQEQERP